MGSGKTVVFSVTRSGTAGVNAGACGNRLQCFKTAVIEAAAATAPVVENAALVQVNVAEPEQDVNMKLERQAAADRLRRRPERERQDRLRRGGGQALARRRHLLTRARSRPPSAASTPARAPSSDKVIVLVAERTNTFASTGFTSSGAPDRLPADDARADGRSVRLPDRDPRLRGRPGRHLLGRSARTTAASTRPPRSRRAAPARPCRASRAWPGS